MEFAGFRIEIDHIPSREMADALVYQLNRPDTTPATAAGLTIRVLDTLDVIEPEPDPAPSFDQRRADQ